MPPKKKRKSSNAQPGIARCQLEFNYSNLPSSSSELKNGHMLYLYLFNEKSCKEAERQINSRYSLCDEPGYLPSAVLSSAWTLVRKTLDKFKKLTDPKELTMFTKICEESFKLKSDEKKSDDNAALSGVPETLLATSGNETVFQETSAASSHDMPDGKATIVTPESCIPEPVTSTSGISTRSTTELLTPRKKKTKEKIRISFFVKSRSS